jgi:hypothetical protein
MTPALRSHPSIASIQDKFRDDVRTGEVKDAFIANLFWGHEDRAKEELFNAFKDLADDAFKAAENCEPEGLDGEQRDSA